MPRSLDLCHALLALILLPGCLDEPRPNGMPIGEACDGSYCFDYGPVLDFGNGRTVRVCQVSDPADDCFVYEVLTPEQQRQAANQSREV